MKCIEDRRLRILKAVAQDMTQPGLSRRDLSGWYGSEESTEGERCTTARSSRLCMQCLCAKKITRRSFTGCAGHLGWG